VDLVLAGADLRQQGLGDVGKRGAQVAIVLDRIDQRRADAAVARGQVRQVQLPQQVVLQGLRFGHPLGGAAQVVIVERAAGGSAVELGPQALVRLPVVGLALLLGLFLGPGAFARRLAHAGGGIRGRVVLGPVQQGIGLHRLGDLRFQLGGGHLQQADRLAQLGRHHQLLAHRCLQAWLHPEGPVERTVRHGLPRQAHHSRKVSPR
jgi:hypothetical protein